MSRGVGKADKTIQDQQLVITDLKMDLEVAYKKIDKLEEIIRQYEHVPF